RSCPGRAQLDRLSSIGVTNAASPRPITRIGASSLPLCLWETGKGEEAAAPTAANGSPLKRTLPQVSQRAPETSVIAPQWGQVVAMANPPLPPRPLAATPLARGKRQG